MRAFVLNWAGEETTETYYPYDLAGAEAAFETLKDPERNPQTRYIGLFDATKRKMVKEFCSIGS
jgi:hypothetical protein